MASGWDPHPERAPVRENLPYWAQADEQAMKDAAIVPVNIQKWPVYHSSQVHGCTFSRFTLNCDPVNAWLSS